jgi:phage terminase large subunit GpA-like protein
MMGKRDLLMDDQAEAAILAVWAQHCRPAPIESISAWADQFREIAKGPEKGRWRTSRTPYLREPMECMSEGSGIEKVVMQFATQLGKTEVLYNTILQRIHRSPMDMMIVQPTLGDSKDHSRERFMPTVRRMPEIATRLSKPSSRDESATWQTKSLAGGATLFFAGANAARSLASKPLGLVCCDEIDGYPMDVDGEGDPLTIVGERMSNYSDRKLLLCSTPTVRDFSRIESEYLASDRRRYFVPCPHCGEFQHLEWGSANEWGIKWQRDATGAARPETAVYICRHCGAAIEERCKTEMLAAGEWRAEMPGAQMGQVAGFHLNKLYSPVGWRSWRWMAAKWLEAKEAAQAGDTTKLKAFVNTSLAETWEEQGDKADEHQLRRRAGDYPLRVVTWGHYVCTLGVDVQGDRLEGYLWAWGRGLERQLVDRAVFYGDPALSESEPGSPWAALTEYRRTPVLHASGKAVPLLACGIDTGGHHTQAVYAYVRNHQHSSVLAFKGSSQGGRSVLGKPTEQDVNWRGAKVKRGVKLWPVGTDTAKAEIYGRLRLTEPGPGYVHLSKHLSPEVFEQLTAERLVTRYVKGHPKLEWVKPAGKRNEALDCAVYALAAAHYLHIDRWREGDWAKWQARVETRDLFDAPAPAEAVPVQPQAEPAAPPAQQPDPITPPKPPPPYMQRRRAPARPTW